MLRQLCRTLSPSVQRVALARYYNPVICTLASRSLSTQSQAQPSNLTHAPSNLIPSDPARFMPSSLPVEGIVGWSVVNNAVKQDNLHNDMQKQWTSHSETILHNLAERRPANAYTGRTVNVSKEDVAHAYKKLEIRLSRNRVKYELRLAERHEKKGAKRRRLSSERWRAQFANEVRKKVALVKEIRRRGS